MVLTLLAGLTGLSEHERQTAESLISVAPALANAEIALATRLRPDSSSAWRDRAEWQSASDPSGARAAAVRAIHLNRRDWHGWEVLGLIDFQLGREGDARFDFTQAAQFNHGFEGYYKLANFAILLNDSATFWQELNLALASAPQPNPDPTLTQQAVDACLGQAVAFAQGPDDPHLRDVIPRSRPDVAADAIYHYLRLNLLTQSVHAWEQLTCTPEETTLCTAATEQLANALLDQGYGAPPATAKERTHEAESIWNAAAKNGWVDPAPPATDSLADGDFLIQGHGDAFSWDGGYGVARTSRIAGGPKRGMNSELLDFNGQQPEVEELFHQMVVVIPGRRYKLSYESRSPRDLPASGVALVAEAAADQRIITVAARLGPNWSWNQAEFVAPQNCTLLKIAMTYERPAGQIRLHSAVFVSDVELRSLP